MKTRAFTCTLGLLLLLAGSTASCIASDWVDEAGARPSRGADGMPPVAPDRPSLQNGYGTPSRQNLAQSGGFLTGSASMMRAGQPVQGAAVRPIGPQMAPIPQLESGADAERFVMNARKDEVVPPDSLKGWLQRTHPEFNLEAQDNPDAVIEVKGAWDNSSQILKSMGIRYHEMKAKELRDYVLTDATKVMVINCEGKVPADAIEPIRQWVIRGGYLISTDWTLGSFLERAFPGMVARNGKNTSGTVDALVTADDPALVAGTQVTRSTWKLDDGSQELRVLRPDVVRVLARSWKLAQDDPTRSRTSDPMQLGVLACEFPYGRGRVLHLVGHFDYNNGNGFLRFILPDAIPNAGIGLRQAIATNFLIQGLERPARPLRARQD